jgi:hypothetical protein
MRETSMTARDPSALCLCGHDAAVHVALARECTATACKGACTVFQPSPVAPSVGTTGHEIDPRGVNHPKHYNIHPAGIECIDVIEHMTANITFTIKHVWRAGLKEGEATLKDIDKALWYLNRERERLVKLGVK